MKKTSKIIKEEYHIPQEDETLYVLHKSVPTQKQYTSDEIILFLEPFSVPTAKQLLMFQTIPGWMRMPKRI
jgi:hypothetical protein